jgi:hypothetical protein
MKNKAVYFMVIALFSVAPLLGQRGTGQGQGRGQGDGQGRPQMTQENVEQRVGRLAATLELNAEQKKTILDYELEQFKKNQVERQRIQGDRDQMRDYMMKQREERDKKYKEVLTEEQWTKYMEDREQRRQNNQDRQRPEGGDRERPPRGRDRG